MSLFNGHWGVEQIKGIQVGSQAAEAPADMVLTLMQWYGVLPLLFPTFINEVGSLC